MTFPISLSYTPEYKDVQIWFPNPEKLPMIKIRNWQQGAYQKDYTEGIETIRSIIGKRAELSLFTDEALEKLIIYTGGYIRDLFRCISDAALRARLRKSEVIESEDAEKALAVLESDINGRYSDELIGKIFYSSGDIDPAMTYCMRAINIRERIYGEKSGLTADSYEIERVRRTDDFLKKYGTIH